MAPTANQTIQNTETTRIFGKPALVVAAALWNILVAIALGAFSIYIFQLGEFGGLGRPVQIFAGAVILVPAGLLLLASGLMLSRDESAGPVLTPSDESPSLSRANNGRYITIAINFTGMVLSLAVLAGLLGMYQSFEYLVDGVMQNAPLTLGFALAYVLYFIAGRLRRQSTLKPLLERGAMIIGIITAVLLLLASDFTGGLLDILSRYGDPLVWLLTIVAIIFGIISVRILYMGRYFGELPDQRVAWQGWFMLAPNIIGFLIFFAGPLLLSFYLSFTNDSVGRTPEIIGLSNYIELMSLEFITSGDQATSAQSLLSFGYSPLGEIQLGGNRLIVGAKDPLFWFAIRNTLVFCLLLVPLSTIPALILSLILNSSLPGMKFYRAVYFLPSVAAVVGTALIWRWLYDPTIGYFNYIISSIVSGLNTTFGISLTDPNIQWLSGPGVVLISIVLLAAWQVVGYNTVLFLAGLQGIPKVLYEAAMIDGANRWQQFRNVTFPMLAPTTFFVMITTIVTGLQVFNEPYALFPARPIPVNATTAVFYLYNKGFTQFEFGYASAVAWVLFAIIFTITLIQFRLSRNEAYE